VCWVRLCKGWGSRVKRGLCGCCGGIRIFTNLSLQLFIYLMLNERKREKGNKEKRLFITAVGEEKGSKKRKGGKGRWKRLKKERRKK